MKALGIVLIVLGIIMMIFTGFKVFTKEEVADIGPIEINKTKETPVSWPPIVGGVLVVAGIVVLVTGRKTA
jgi:hypothetical protein